MKLDTKTYILLLVAFFISPSYNFVKEKTQSQSVTEIKADKSKDGLVDKISGEFKKIESKEDKLLIHKLFAGANAYLKNCESLGSTSQFDPILNRVQTSYGWNRDKYKDFTSSVSDYLLREKYDEPKELKTKQDREAFSKIFETLAGATANE